MRKFLLALFLFVPGISHAFNSSIPVLISSGVLQAGTTAGYNVSSGTVKTEFNIGQGGSILKGVSTGVSILGTTTNDNATTGNYGEYISSVSLTFKNAQPTGQYGDLLSVTLTAGDWDVTAVVAGNGTTATRVKIGISQTSGNSSTGLTEGDNLLELLPPTAAVDAGGVIPNYRASINATNSYFLKYYFDYPSGTPKAAGRLSARRIR